MTSVVGSHSVSAPSKEMARLHVRQQYSNLICMGVFIVVQCSTLTNVVEISQLNVFTVVAYRLHLGERMFEIV